MENMVKDLHEICETLNRSLKEANEKIRNAGGKLSTSDLDYINKLTHSLKSVKTSIAMIEAEEMEDGGSYDDGSYRMRGYSRDGRDYRGPYRGSYDSGSYARGRGPYANRDSMGRYASGYSRDGYSNAGNMVDELRDMMQQMPDEQSRQDMQRLIDKMQNR